MITRQHYDDARWRAKTARSTGAREFRQVMKRLERQGTVRLVEERMKANTGRPRVVSWAGFMRLCALAAFHSDSTFHLVDVMHVADGLTPAQRREVGITRCDYHHIEYSFGVLAEAGDERICLATGEIKESRLRMSLDDLVICIESTPEKAPSARMAIDGTLIETHAARRSWAKDHKEDFEGQDDYLVPDDLERSRASGAEPGYPKVAEDGTLIHSVDPDARDQVQTGKNRSPGNIRLGFECHNLVDTREPGSDSHAPPIIRAHRLSKGSTHRGLEGIAALDSMKRVLGHVPTEVVDDRGYSNSVAEKWAIPLFERGIRQVFDLHPNNRGAAPGPIKGTQWRDGLLLVSDKVTKHKPIPTRSPRESSQVKADRAEAVAKRQAYAFALEDWNREKGTVRLVGPAVRGQVRCVNHPASMRLKAVKQHSRGARSITRPTTNHRAGEDCACGKTKVVPIQDVIRFYQPYVWGSEDWEKAYASRNLAETANSNLKDHHGRLTKGSIKVLGQNKIDLALAFFIFAVNTRLILGMPSEAYERWTGEPDPYLPDPADPAWWDGDHPPQPARAGPTGSAHLSSSDTSEGLAS